MGFKVGDKFLLIKEMGGWDSVLEIGKIYTISYIDKYRVLFEGSCKYYTSFHYFVPLHKEELLLYGK